MQFSPIKLYVSVLAAAVLLFSCKKEEDWSTRGPGSSDTTINTPSPTLPVPSLATARSWLVDKNATEQTAAMFYQLKKLSANNILFGHQDATKRGVLDAATQWANEQHLGSVPKDRSDVKEVTGAYPAVYGHDFHQFVNFQEGQWFDYEKQIARELTIEAYNRGGVNTYAWHYSNPVSEGSFYWDQSPVEAVSKIIPGGSHHDVYKSSLKEIAEFAKSLQGADGKLVPVIFRPFHEFDGDWFWWGKSHCTPEQYKKLFQFTVEYLRDSLEVRNFLYAWSPDRGFDTEAQYLERYPGDDYVDLVGMDNYWDMRTGTAVTTASRKLKIVSDYAKKSNKLAAMTETGLQNLTQPDWYTQMLLKVLKTEKVELSYVMVWANTISAFWTPYKGHAAEQDFKTFKNNGYVLFGDKSPLMYQLK